MRRLALLRKIVGDSRWLLLSCMATILAFSWIRVIIVASVQTYRFERIARNLPDFLKNLSPVPLDQLINYHGLISITFEEPMAYLVMTIWTVARASDCISGELGRGTMELLLAQPVSRTRYLWTHSLVTLTGVVLIASMALAGTAAGIHTAQVETQARPSGFWSWTFRNEPTAVTYQPLSDLVDTQVFFPAVMNYAFLGIFLAGLTTVLSAMDRYRWRPIAIVVAFYVVQTILEVLGLAVEGFEWVLKLTILSIYEPVAIVTETVQGVISPWVIVRPDSYGYLPDLGPLGYNIVLASFSIVFFVAAWIIFTRRDLPAPL